MISATLHDSMAREAAGMSLADLRRHAAVSLQNRHRCNECFTCACVSELERRKTVEVAR